MRKAVGIRTGNEDVLHIVQDPSLQKLHVILADIVLVTFTFLMLLPPAEGIVGQIGIAVVLFSISALCAVCGRIMARGMIKERT